MGFHGVVFAGSQRDGVGGDVGGFDADHGEPAGGAHVGESCGEFRPGVPDDGGFGLGFVDGDAASVDRVVDVYGDKGVEIGAIGFAGEGEERIGLTFLLEVFSLVEVLGIGEADDGDLLRVSHGEVGVKGLFEVERLAALIGDGELCFEFDTESDVVDEDEVIVAEGATGVGGGEGEGEMEVVTGEGSEGEGPVGGAGEAVGRARQPRGFVAWVSGVRGVGSEPGEDDGDAAADRLAGLEEGALGEEEHGMMAVGLPLGNVRALEEEFGRAGGGGDVGAEEALLSLREGEDAGDSELVGERLEIHLEQCSAFGRRVGIEETGDAMIDAILCDIDGTLVQSNWLHAEAWQMAFAAIGIDLDREDVRRQIGKGGDELIPVYVPWWKRRQVEEPLKAYRKFIFEQDFLSKVKPLPGARELLVRAKDAGIRVALASSADKDELEVYKKIVGMEDLVEKETSANDANKSKPHPDIFSAALKRLKLPARKCMALGDTPYDAEAAGLAGLRTIGVTTGGWSREELMEAGCVEAYESVAELLQRFEESALVREGIR